MDRFGLESALACVERYIIEAAGWDKLPVEWQEVRTPRALYAHLIKIRMDDPDRVLLHHQCPN